MRYYVIDEMPELDLEKIKEHLNSKGVRSQMEEIFWIELPHEHMSIDQSEKKESHPYMFSIEVSRKEIRAELFIRTLNSFNCEFQGFAIGEQRGFIMNYMDRMLENLQIQN